MIIGGRSVTTGEHMPEHMAERASSGGALAATGFPLDRGRLLIADRLVPLVDAVQLLAA
jgi:hypothetical protein